jgi:endonuclease G
MKKLFLIILIALSVFLYAEPTSIIGDRYEKSAGDRSYVLYYNEDAEQAALVWYVLTSDDIAKNNSSISRPAWKEDKTIRTKSATPDDYKNSGYDQGHLAPDADFSITRQILDLTYVLSNASPQYHSFNTSIWLRLENYGRELAASKGKVLIVTGPCLRPDLTRSSNIIGKKNLILVPDYFYKLFIYRENGKLVFDGYIVPHTNEVGGDYKTYVTAPEQIEEWGQFVLDDIEEML